MEGKRETGGEPRPVTSDPRWLVLIHQVPARPDYLRVKVGRRLRQLGAVPIKNSVYVLPDGAAGRTALAGVAREIHRSGGEAAVCEARFVAGLTGEGVAELFRAALDAEYAPIADAARQLAAALRRRSARPRRGPSASAALARLKRRLDQVVERDRFEARGRAAAAGAISLAEDLLQGVEDAGRRLPDAARPPRGATWVTRTGIMVDRISSAWLIRRFIDREARFKFVPSRGYRPRPGELRFDMAGAEYTHEGGRCTFETLVQRFGLSDPALAPIAGIVHDIDLEDGRHGRPETAGVARLITGLAIARTADQERLAQGSAVFDHLYESFRSRRGS